MGSDRKAPAAAEHLSLAPLDHLVPLAAANAFGFVVIAA